MEEIQCLAYSLWLLWPHVNLQPTQRWASPYGSTEDGSGPLSPLGARPPSANMSVSSPLQAHSAASMGRTPANRDGGHSAVQTPQQVRSVPPMLSVSLSLSLYKFACVADRYSCSLTPTAPHQQTLAADMNGSGSPRAPATPASPTRTPSFNHQSDADSASNQQRHAQLEMALRDAQQACDRERQATQSASAEIARLSGKLVQRDADAAARASEVRARARATDADTQAQAQFQQNLAHTTAELSSLRQFVNQLQNEKDMLLEQKNSRERIVVSLSSQKAPSGAVVGDG